MSKKPYWELLRDPRWQRARLEVMKRDEFKCRQCGAADKTLNVHHTYYVKDCKPWDYDRASLLTLCEECHLATSNRIAEITRLAGLLNPWMCDIYIGMLRVEVAGATNDPSALVLIENHEQKFGVAHAIGINDQTEIYCFGKEAERNGGRISMARLERYRVKAEETAAAGNPASVGDDSFPIAGGGGG